MFEVTLRPITLSDTEDIIKWRNSDAVRLNMQDQRILTVEQHLNFYHENVENGKIIQYIIMTDNKPIGTIYSWLLENKRAEIGLFIGEQMYRGKGYGTKALGLLLSKLHDYNILSFRLRVRRDNIPAIKLYRKFGFETEFAITNDSIVQMIKE